MNYLIFDLETNGLPKSYNGDPENTENWPLVVQIAWNLFDSEGKLLEERCFIRKYDGFQIDDHAAAVHGVTKERMENGVHLDDILLIFKSHLLLADTVVAHNLSFDRPILCAEFYRQQETHMGKTLQVVNGICTMKSTTDFCGLPGKFGKPKWPTLQELHVKLFGTGFEDAHDALVDVRATAKCFFELKKKGIL